MESIFQHLATLAGHTVTLVGHTAWPAVAIFLFVLFRAELRRAAASLTERMAVAKKIAVTKSGIQIEDFIAASAAKTDSLQIGQEDLRMLVSRLGRDVGGALSRDGSSEDGQQELKSLADEYLAIDDEDPQARIARKNDLVRRMELEIVGRAMDRSELAELDHDGIRAALAGAVHFDPFRGDIDLLAKIANGAQSRHVLYKIVLALSRLVDTEKIAPSDLSAATQILDLAANRADRALEKRIRKTRALMEYTFGDGILSLYDASHPTGIQ